ncbi:MAG: HPr family phosphocarrier protein [Gemmatimonadota bacterium]|nr:HPr family phosphocarrier protein [Gemmatimonadota bacterium]
MSVYERTATIRNRLGLHARPAAEFVKLAGAYDAEIWAEKGGLEVNAKSIMGVMMLAAEAGSTILVRASGTDAVDAVDALVMLIESGFDEELEEEPLAPDDGT